MNTEKLEAVILAGDLAARIKTKQQLIADIDAALECGGWCLHRCVAVAPAKDSSKPAEIDLLPFGMAGEDISQSVLKAMRETNQARLDELTKQLEAM